jgi:hypothetical protein
MTSRGPGFEVALFGQAGGAPRGQQVARAGGVVVTSHLKQVGPDGVESVVSGNPLVRVQAAEQVKAGLGAVHHGGRNGHAQPYHSRRLDAFKYLVQGQDLPPVRVLGAGGLGMDSRDRGLKLAYVLRLAARRRGAALAPPNWPRGSTSAIWLITACQVARTAGGSPSRDTG